MRAQRPRRREAFQPLQQRAGHIGVRGRDGVGGADAREAHGLVRCPQLPEAVTLRGVVRGLAFEAQWLVGHVEHADGIARGMLRDVGLRLAEWARRFAAPAQRGAVAPLGCAPHAEAPGQGRAFVVAVAVRGQPDVSATALCHNRADAVDEFARARGDRDALHGHAVEIGKRGTQRGVARIGIVRRVGLAQCGQHHGARADRVAVGREVVRRGARLVGAAVHHGLIRHAHLASNGDNIASEAITASPHAARSPSCAVRAVSADVAARPSPFSA
ncbi:hypothetical protein D3C86_1493010 [compost metagenome]